MQVASGYTIVPGTFYINDVVVRNNNGVSEIYTAVGLSGNRDTASTLFGGEDYGLYKSSDGGNTWRKIHQGLPEEKGKMAISVSRANPNWVYALIESDSRLEKGGLFVSKNSGEFRPGVILFFLS